MREFAKLRLDFWWRERVAECFLAVVMAPAFAWMAPFTTNDNVFLARIGYWVLMLCCWFLTAAVMARAIATSGLLRDAPHFVRELATVAGASLLLVPVVGAATHALTGWQASVSEVFELYFQIAVIGSGVTLIARTALTCRPDGGPVAFPAFADGSMREVLHEPLRESVTGPLLQHAPVDSAALEPIPAVPPAPGRLIGRMPANLRGPIIALEMEDHYVRVHTERGSALVLLRLSDAMAEAAPAAGRQVHRSWWVADEAVAQFERVGRAGQIRLHNGLTVPVSQRYIKELEERFDSSRSQD